MTLDTFERYKHNFYLSPITSETIEKLGERSGLTDESRVLDVACGKGGAALTLAAKFRCVVTGIESRVEFAEEARRRAMFGDLGLYVNIINAETDNLPFDDHYFDLALMFGLARPYDSEKATNEFARVVRPDGWLALAEIVWKPGASATASGPLREWLDEFAPWEIDELDGRRARFQKAGFEVESAELEGDASWENFYAPQAHSILENRQAYPDSREAQATLDHWQKELEIFHSGGGRESLGYACFLLRRP